ncbi:hypothetical protein [Ornithinimicrobium kibberense]|uniref:hypothetical protein n=1 Tax=Ornithinimicrobium kibberense TaxID=282060 RepID=UPI00360EC03F
MSRRTHSWFSVQTSITTDPAAARVTARMVMPEASTGRRWLHRSTHCSASLSCDLFSFFRGYRRPDGGIMRRSSAAGRASLPGPCRGPRRVRTPVRGLSSRGPSPGPPDPGRATGRSARSPLVPVEQRPVVAGAAPVAPRTPGDRPNEAGPERYRRGSSRAGGSSWVVSRAVLPGGSRRDPATGRSCQPEGDAPSPNW